MAREHQHYCAEHDHRFRCTVDPCVLATAWTCDKCRCGARLVCSVAEPLAYVCVDSGKPDDTRKHDRLVVETSRRSA